MGTRVTRMWNGGLSAPARVYPGCLGVGYLWVCLGDTWVAATPGLGMPSVPEDPNLLAWGQHGMHYQQHQQQQQQQQYQPQGPYQQTFQQQQQQAHQQQQMLQMQQARAFHSP